MFTENFAFTAVINEHGFEIGAAIEGSKGYSPTTYGRFDSYELASEQADYLNERMGLTPKRAIQIVLGTMSYGD